MIRDKRNHTKGKLGEQVNKHKEQVKVLWKEVKWMWKRELLRGTSVYTAQTCLYEPKDERCNGAAGKEVIKSGRGLEKLK